MNTEEKSQSFEEWFIENGFPVELKCTLAATWDAAVDAASEYAIEHSGSDFYVKQNLKSS